MKSRDVLVQLGRQSLETTAEFRDERTRFLPVFQEVPDHRAECVETVVLATVEVQEHASLFRREISIHDTRIADDPLFVCHAAAQ
jgi:hypothetical protein